MRRSNLPVQRYLVTGVLTVIPLWLSFLVFEFILGLLSRFGTPWVQALITASERFLPALSAALGRDWIQNLLAALFTLAALIGLGWLATQVLGRRLIHGFERLIGRIPLIQSVYGGTKRVLEAFQTPPQGTQRVVLIEFPTPEMKAVGLVTRVLRDAETGEEIAAVYVPTTPNPTSGYLELVPAKRLVPTDWTVDQAMSFIISGGALAPDAARFGFRQVADTGARPPQ